jgi:hypothetical protein
MESEEMNDCFVYISMSAVCLRSAVKYPMNVSTTTAEDQQRDARRPSRAEAVSKYMHKSREW